MITLGTKGDQIKIIGRSPGAGGAFMKYDIIGTSKQHIEEESDEWAASPEGQATIAELTGSFGAGKNAATPQPPDKNPAYLDMHRLPEDERIRQICAALATEAPLCRGGLTVLNNQCILSRNRAVAEAQKQVGRDDKVFFRTLREFIAHHER